MLDDGMVGTRRKPVRRTSQERASIVAESYEVGATVCAVAGRHGIAPSQLSYWRSAARAKKSNVLRGQSAAFADVSILPGGHGASLSTDGRVEIAVGHVVIRLPTNAASKRIADIAHRLAKQV